MPPTRHDIEAAVIGQFGADQAAGILKLLDRIEGSGRERLQMCVLMLAEGRIENIKHYVKCAETDYRDVLYWADPHGKLI
jgi:hypothetical protein